MRNSGTNKQQYQLDRSALKMSPQMSNSRHQISNVKLDNVKNLQNIDCATLNQWKSHQRPITAPMQMSQYLTQQLQNQLKSNQNHLICTCPPEVHKALLEQQLLQHQSHHQHQIIVPQHLQHFQPCPHQRQTMKSMVASTGLDPQSIYALISQQQSFIPPQLKSTTQTSVSAESTPTMTLQATPIQTPMNHPITNVQPTYWFSRQSKPPETMVEARAQITKMESQLMYLTSWIQNNWHSNSTNPPNGNYVDNNDSTNVPTNVSNLTGLSQHGGCMPCYIVTNDNIATDVRDSNVEATPSNSSLDSAYSAKSTTSSDNNSNVPRQQITNPDNSQSSLLPQMSEEKLPTDVIDKLQNSKLQLQSMKDEIGNFRKWNQAMRFSFKDDLNETFLKIKKLIESNPEMNAIPIRKERENVDKMIVLYTSDVESQIEKLEDLEVAIEDLRMNVLNRRCRVNIEEVEVLALHLSKISKDLTKNKAEFPVLEKSLKNVMLTEMEMMKNDERFLEAEPKKVENSLRLCKKLISTLFTLKRLGSVQENTGSDNIPEIRSVRDPKPKDKMAVLEEIKTISLDHEYRMQQIALSEKLRECRRRMLTSHESLKFEKSLELTAKNLKSVKATPICNSASDERKNLMDVSTNTSVQTYNKDCDSLSSLTDSDLEITTKPDIKIINKSVHNHPPPLLINDLSTHASSSDTSNDQDSSDNGCSSNHHRSNNNRPSSSSSSSKVTSKQGTILKTSQHSSRSNRSSKVAFNRTVTVEGGCEVLQLNCPEDDYDEDLSSMTFTSPPPPPPPRLSSQDETVSPPEESIGSNNSVWEHGTDPGP